MAFGGVLVNFTPTAGGATFSRTTDATLAARAGAPNITATDTGQLTTGTPVANQDQLPVNLGPGAGNWVADHLNKAKVTVSAVDNITAGSIVYMSAKAITGSNLVVTIHNRGAGATGALEIYVEFLGNPPTI